MALIEMHRENPGDMEPKLREALEAAGLRISPDGRNPIQAYVIQHPGAPWCFGDEVGRAVIKHRQAYLDQALLPEAVLNYLDDLVRRLWDDPRCQELRANSDYWKVYGGDNARPLW